MNWLKSAHILIRLLNVIWVCTDFVSSVERVLHGSASKQNREALIREQFLHEYSTDAELTADSDSVYGDDADIFVAEIYAEQPTSFEQLFRPLARYKKAVLGMDAQIEPIGKYSEKFHPVQSEFKTVLQHPNQLNDITAKDMQSNSSIQFHDINRFSHDKTVPGYQENLEETPRDFHGINSTQFTTRGNSFPNKLVDPVEQGSLESNKNGINHISLSLQNMNSSRPIDVERESHKYHTTVNNEQSGQRVDQNQSLSESEGDDDVGSGNSGNNEHLSHFSVKVTSVLHELKTSGVYSKLNRLENESDAFFSDDDRPHNFLTEANTPSPDKNRFRFGDSKEKSFNTSENTDVSKTDKVDQNFDAITRDNSNIRIMTHEKRKEYERENEYSTNNLNQSNNWTTMKNKFENKLESSHGYADSKRGESTNEGEEDEDNSGEGLEIGSASSIQSEYENNIKQSKERNFPNNPRVWLSHIDKQSTNDDLQRNNNTETVNDHNKASQSKDFEHTTVTQSLSVNANMQKERRKEDSNNTEIETKKYDNETAAISSEEEKRKTSSELVNRKESGFSEYQIEQPNANKQDNVNKQLVNNFGRKNIGISNQIKQPKTIDSKRDGERIANHQSYIPINKYDNKNGILEHYPLEILNDDHNSLNSEKGYTIKGRPGITSMQNGDLVLENHKQKKYGNKVNLKNVEISSNLGRMRERLQEGKMEKKKHKMYNQDDSNFAMMFMSEKARQLYRELIHDTRNAFKSKQFSKEKRRRQHVSNKKVGKYHKLNGGKNNNVNKHFKMNYKDQTHASTNKHKVKKLNTNQKVHDLAHRILNVMTENDNLLHQENVIPIQKSSTYQNGHSMEAIGISNGLDTQNSLIEKLAELRYARNKGNALSEVPTPSKEKEYNEDVTSLENEDDNPGRTIMQKQKMPGLGPNVDLDKMEDESNEQDHREIVDGEMEGELEKNQSIDEYNREADIGQLTAVKSNASLQLADSQMTTRTSNIFLNEYNKDESLRNEDHIDEQHNNSVNNLIFSSLKKHLDLQNFINETVNEINAKQMKEHLSKGLKQKHDQPKSMYYVGNSSSWKHHPIVSVNIEPLVDLFYQVNHQNLIDLVENEGKNQSRDAADHEKLGWRSGLKLRSKAMKHKKKQRNNRRKGHKLFINDVKTESGYLRAAINKTHWKEKNAFLKLNNVKVNKDGSLVPEFKNNMPSTVKYYRIDDAAKLGAVCIDGSIPGYYYRQGHGSGKKKWIIHLHGGAWCYNIPTCFRRSFSVLGSTRHWSAENITNFFQGILSDKPETNPNFHNWNVVVQTYCDGGLFSGRRKKPIVFQGHTMYFRGRQILKALIKSLAKKSLENASDVILSGTSAGGLAVLLQSDYMKQKLPAKAKVRGLVDAGFFLDVPGQNWPNIVKDQFKGLYEIHKPKLVHQCVEKKSGNERYKCLFPQYSLMHSSIPIYFVNALYDHWQLSELQNLRCVYNNEQCLPEQREKILNFRNEMFSALQEAIMKKRTAGLYADSCIAHGQVIVDYTWSRVKVNNLTIGDAFSHWLDDENYDKNHLNVDCKVPCNGSCPKQMVRSCMENFQGIARKYRTKRGAELC